MSDEYSPKDLIKGKISIEEVVSEYVNLKPAGTKLKGLSPFSVEKTPSFFVSPDEGYFYCFSTQKGGDIFTFIQEVEGVSFKEALQSLADRAGVELHYSNTDIERTQKINREIDILEESQNFFREKLNDDIFQYIKKRGIESGIEDKFKLGYAPDSWDSLTQHLRAANYSEEDIVSSGVAIKSKERVYDRFRNRLIFPLIASNKIIGFAGRTMGDDSAKYINSPETLLYDKSSFIYALDNARVSIRKHKFSILVEGYLDVLLANQNGFEMTVASSGTAVTEEQLFGLKKLSQKIIIAFDGDSAGVDASIKAAKKALGIGMDVRMAVLPIGKDPADIILENIDNWKQIIKNSKSIIEFLLGNIGEDSDPTKRIVEVRNSILPVIKSIKTNLLKEKYIDIVSDFCGLSRDSIKIELDDVDSEDTRKLKQTTPSNQSSLDKRINSFFELKGQISSRVENFTESEKTLIDEIEKRIPLGNYINTDKKYFDFVQKTKQDNENSSIEDITKDIHRAFVETGYILLKDLINIELKDLVKSRSNLTEKEEVAILDKKCENLVQLLKTIDTK